MTQPLTTFFVVLSFLFSAACGGASGELSCKPPSGCLYSDPSRDLCPGGSGCGEEQPGCGCTAYPGSTTAFCCPMLK
jgi:hypothetical protein